MKKALTIILIFCCFYVFADTLTTGQSIAQDIDTISAIASNAAQSAPGQGATIPEWIAWVMGSVIAALVGIIAYFKNKYGKKK